MKESNFKFSNPIIENIVYSVSEKFDATLSPSVKNQFEVKIGKSENCNEAVVRLTVIVDDDQGQINSPFSISLTIASKFFWDDSYDEETVNSLLSVNAPALLLGYARPIVASITTSCPCGAYNLPFYNFVQ